MADLPVSSGTSREGARGCRCGHPPLDHLRVVALESRSEGNWRLEPSGPCEKCGKEACPKYRTDVARSAPPRTPQ
ncbi:MAG: hypothetical protein L3K17_04515 [Thermoplasmata archaeon]|nr:hypothetical protein [Thermoplasmata archaeon]